MSSGTRSLTRNPHTQWQRLVEDNLKSLEGTDSGFGSTHSKSSIVKGMVINKEKTLPSSTKCVVKRGSDNALTSSSLLQRDWSVSLEKGKANLDQEKREQEVKALLNSKRNLPTPFENSPSENLEHDGKGKRLVASMATNENYGNVKRLLEERSAVDRRDNNMHTIISETNQGYCSRKLGKTSHGYKNESRPNRNHHKFPSRIRDRTPQPIQSKCAPDLLVESLESVTRWTPDKTVENYLTSEIPRKSKLYLDGKAQIKSEKLVNNDIECARHDDGICHGSRMKEPRTQIVGRRRGGLRKTTSRAYCNDSMIDPVTNRNENTKCNEAIFTDTKMSLSRPYLANNNHNENIGDGFSSHYPQKLCSSEERSPVNYITDFDQGDETMERNNKLQTFALLNSQMSTKKLIFKEGWLSFFFNHMDMRAGGDWVFQNQNWQRTQSEFVNALDSFFPNGRMDSPNSFLITGPQIDCQGCKGGLFQERSEEGSHGLSSNEYHDRYHQAMPNFSSRRLIMQRSTRRSGVSLEEINRSTHRRFSKNVQVRKGRKRQKSSGLVVDRGNDDRKLRCIADSLVGENSCLPGRGTDVRLSPLALADLKAETKIDKVHLNHGHFDFDLEVKSGRRSLMMSLSESSLMAFNELRFGEKSEKMLSSDNRRFDFRMTKIDRNNESLPQFPKANAWYANKAICSPTTRSSVKECTEEENYILNSNHSLQGKFKIQYSHSKKSDSWSRINCRLFEDQIVYMEDNNKYASETEKNVRSKDELLYTEISFEHTPMTHEGVSNNNLDSLCNSHSECLPHESRCLTLTKGETSEIHLAEPKLFEDNCQITITDANNVGGGCEFLENKSRQPEDKLAFDENKNNPTHERSIEDHVKLGKDKIRNLNEFFCSSKPITTQNDNGLLDNSKWQIDEKRRFFHERPLLTVTKDASFSAFTKGISKDTSDFSQSKIVHDAFLYMNDKNGVDNNIIDNDSEMKCTHISRRGDATNHCFKASHVPTSFTENDGPRSENDTEMKYSHGNGSAAIRHTCLQVSNFASPITENGGPQSHNNTEMKQSHENGRAATRDICLKASSVASSIIENGSPQSDNDTEMKYSQGNRRAAIRDICLQASSVASPIIKNGGPQSGNDTEMRYSRGSASDDSLQASYVPSHFILMDENSGLQSDDLSTDEIKVTENDEQESRTYISHGDILNLSTTQGTNEMIKFHIKKEVVEHEEKIEPLENESSAAPNSWIRKLDEYFPLPQVRDTCHISLQTVQPKEQFDFSDLCKSDVNTIMNGNTLVRKSTTANKAEKDERKTQEQGNLLRCASNDDLHQSSLECLLEQLIHRGKIKTACIISLDREVLAISKNASLSLNDVTALCDGAMGRYDGLMKITLFDDMVFMCFQWDDYTMFMGRAANTLLVSKLSANSLVVGFSQVTTSGSCMKEITEFAHVLKGRGL